MHESPERHGEPAYETSFQTCCRVGPVVLCGGVMSTWCCGTCNNWPNRVESLLIELRCSCPAQCAVLHSSKPPTSVQLVEVVTTSHDKAPGVTDMLIAATDIISTQVEMTWLARAKPARAANKLTMPSVMARLASVGCYCIYEAVASVTAAAALTASWTPFHNCSGLR